MLTKSDLVALASRYYRPHCLAIGILSAPVLILMLFFAQWWLFWPLMIWALVFMVHFLVFKSLTVSSDWIAERTTRTADKAYDLAIIEALQGRYHPASLRSGQNRPGQDPTVESDAEGPAPNERSGREP